MVRVRVVDLDNNLITTDHVPYLRQHGDLDGAVRRLKC